LYGNPNRGSEHLTSTWRVCEENSDALDDFRNPLVLWLVGFVSFHAIGAYIHILLVPALVVLLIQFINGRRTI
jgi:hypothetical protein